MDPFPFSSGSSVTSDRSGRTSRSGFSSGSGSDHDSDGEFSAPTLVTTGQAFDEYEDLMTKTEALLKVARDEFVLIRDGIAKVQGGKEVAENSEKRDKIRSLQHDFYTNDDAQIDHLSPFHAKLVPAPSKDKMEELEEAMRNGESTEIVAYQQNFQYNLIDLRREYMAQVALRRLRTDRLQAKITEGYEQDRSNIQILTENFQAEAKQFATLRPEPLRLSDLRADQNQENPAFLNVETIEFRHQKLFKTIGRLEQTIRMSWLVPMRGEQPIRKANKVMETGLSSRRDASQLNVDFYGQAQPPATRPSAHVSSSPLREMFPAPHSLGTSPLSGRDGMSLLSQQLNPFDRDPVLFNFKVFIASS